MRLVILHTLRRVLMDLTKETSKSQNMGEKDQETATLKSQNMAEKISVPERLEAEAKFNLSAGNSAFNDPEITCFIQVSSGSKANVLNKHKSTEEHPIARKYFASRVSCTEKVSHRLYQSVNRDKESVNSCQPGVKQNKSSFCFKTEEQARKRKEERTNFLCLIKRRIKPKRSF
ncbi:hypothetical protein CQW23_33817 [Capsicum baccatum]|uniref:TPX2 C-terminal domain-containing protein n=1 Tax=Capsicum baccatum TaxID=33114 RepID=A0A2G2V0T1_CAPBA|nr:hypothetical protein CQW23_33817 [Capsicum baccatum]